MTLKIIAYLLGYCLLLGNRDALGECNRTLGVKIFVDSSYTQLDGWRTHTSNAFQVVARIFQAEFDLCLRLDGLEMWNSYGCKDSHECHKAFKVQSQGSESDLQVGISGNTGPSTDSLLERSQIGRSQFLGGNVLVRVPHKAYFRTNHLVYTLTHEMAHCFGAFHVSDSTSIMYFSTPVGGREVFTFDSCTKQIVVTNSRLDLRKGPSNIDIIDTATINDLYRQFAHDMAEHPIARIFCDSARFLYELGSSPNTVVRLFARAELFPGGVNDNFSTYYALALIEDHQKTKADSILQVARIHMPDNPMVEMASGYAMMGRSQFDSAIVFLRASYNHGSNTPDLFRLLCRAFSSTNEPDSVEMYNKLYLQSLLTK